MNSSNLQVSDEAKKKFAAMKTLALLAIAWKANKIVD